MTKPIKTIYVDCVEFRDRDAPIEEMRGYTRVDREPGWVVWRWADETVVIPADRIASIVTQEEPE